MVDRALIDQLAAADDAGRRALVAAHPEILSKGFREALSGVGNSISTGGDLAEAERYYRTSLFLGREYRLPDSEAGALNNIGIVFGRRGDQAGARSYFDQAMAVAIANRDLATIQSSVTNLTILQRRAGDLDGALVSFQRGLELARSLGDRGATARTLNNIGVVYDNLGNYARALDYYLESLSIKEENQADIVDVVTTIGNIGALYNKQGDFGLALEYYQRALDLAEKNGATPTTVTSILNNMGHAYRATGDTVKAREKLTQSLALAEKGGEPIRISTSTYNLGNVARDEGRMDEAEALHRRALSMRDNGDDRLGLVESLTTMGNILNQRNRPEEALPYATRAVALAATSRLLNQQWKAQLTLGNTHQQLGHLDEARTNYAAAIAMVETLRLQTAGGERSRQQYLADRLGPFYALASLEAESHRAFEALTVVDAARARALIDVIETGRPATRQLTDAQRAQERSVNQALLDASNQLDTEARKPKPNPQRLAEIDASVAKARITRDALLGEFYTERAELRFARGQTPDITRAGVNATLDSGTALVTFVLDDKQAWAYVVTHGADGPVVEPHLLPITKRELTTLATRFAGEIAGRNLAFSATARALYDALFAQADARLATVRHVIIVPDGVLWQVPFQALQTARGRFLIEERAVSYAPSIAALSALESRNRSRATLTPHLVAFGDPAVSSATGRTDVATSAAGTNPARRGVIEGGLPEAAREVRALGRLYGPARSEVLVAADATEAALRERVARATVLHIATHGVLDNSNPMYSHVRLAPSDGNAPADHTTDGRLEAWEVLDLGITAKLAVLSACRTAGGSGLGEGVIGLSWSLFAAGASTAVVSQWEVDSASTTALMIAFHERLLKPGATTTAEALRQAELTLLKNPAYRHPFYWAGFLAVGAK